VARNSNCAQDMLLGIRKANGWVVSCEIRLASGGRFIRSKDDTHVSSDHPTVSPGEVDHPGLNACDVCGTGPRDRLRRTPGRGGVVAEVGFTPVTCSRCRIALLVWGVVIGIIESSLGRWCHGRFTLLQGPAGLDACVPSKARHSVYRRLTLLHSVTRRCGVAAKMSAGESV